MLEIYVNIAKNNRCTVVHLKIVTVKSTTSSMV